MKYQFNDFSISIRTLLIVEVQLVVSLFQYVVRCKLSDKSKKMGNGQNYPLPEKYQRSMYIKHTINNTRVNKLSIAKNTNEISGV